MDSYGPRGGRGGRGRGFRGGGGWRGGGGGGGHSWGGGGRRGGRGGGSGGWRGGGSDRGGRGGGGRGRFGGRGGGFDFNDRRPAEPTPETQALMGTRATEATMGITHFIVESDSGFSGVLKQRYSDFIVQEISCDGEVSKGTDFPGLLAPIERTPPPLTPGPQAGKPTAGEGAAPEKGSQDSGEGGEGEGQTAEEKKKEMEKTVKAGVSTLLSALGEESAAKIEAFILEGLSMEGRDKRKLTLPPSDKAQRTQVYTLLKQTLSKFILAITVDEPTSTAPRSTDPDSKPEEEKSRTATDDSSTPNPMDAPSNADRDASVNPDQESSGKRKRTGSNDGEQSAKVSKIESQGAAAAGSEGAKAPDNGHEPDSNTQTSSEMGKQPVAKGVVNPNAPKCVQIKMNPDWRGQSSKRRRGALGGAGPGVGGRWAWPDDRPEYCRFVLYKENIDTMGAVSRLCRYLHVSNKSVGYAGTKDKRAVTSQWCTVKRKTIEEIRTFNRPLGTFQGPIVLVGNLSYVEEPLQLGGLKANRFGIVLRNLTLPQPVSDEHEKNDSTTSKMVADNDANTAAATNGDAANGPSENNGAESQNDSEERSGFSAEKEAESEARKAEEIRVETGDRLRETIDQRCSCVKEHGFINYFGLQRFGTGGAPTSEVGLAMLKQDWEGAVKLVMMPRLGENEATHDSKVYFHKNPGDPEGALKRLPFFMDAEKNMMQALVKGGPKAHIQALRAVPKNLQLMYLHAFQSLVWNLAASERVKLYGRYAVVVGDLVFPKNSTVDIDAATVEPEAETRGDANGLVGVDEGQEDGGGCVTEGRESTRARNCRESLPEVHVVTAEDVENDTFKITDVVLPMPGCGVSYPTNAVGECYKRALKERGLTEACFSSSSEKAFVLGGMYRRMLQVPKDITWEIKRYDDHTQHLMNTDIDDLLDIDDARRAAEKAAEDAKQKERHTEEQEQDEQKVDEGADTEKLPVTDTHSAPSNGIDVEGGQEPIKAKTETGDKTPLDVSTKSPMRFHALCLRFTLPTASYATMCLREITRQDTSTSFHTSLNALPAGQHPANGVVAVGDDSNRRPAEMAESAKGSAGGVDADSGGGASSAVSSGAAKKGAVIRVGASFGKK